MGNRNMRRSVNNFRILQRRTEEYHKRVGPRLNKFRKDRGERWGAGKVGMGRSPNAILAEKIGVRILEKMGFENIEHWSSQHSEFLYDISGQIHGEKHVFQVSTYPYTKKKLPHRFAISAGLTHKALFISLQNNEYIIKNFSKGGFATMSLKDEKSALKFSRQFIRLSKSWHCR